MGDNSILLLAGVLKKNSVSDGSTTSITDVMNRKGSTISNSQTPRLRRSLTKVLARVIAMLAFGGIDSQRNS